MGTDGKRRVAIVGAMRSELRPVAKQLGLAKATIGGIELRTGQVGDTEVVAVLVGIGPEAARRATDALLAAIPVDEVLMIGIAGGIDPTFEIGDLVVPEVVLDGATGSEHRPLPIAGHPARGVLHTSSELILDAERQGGLAERGVVALDMETAAVAQACEAKGVPWSVVRSISDRATDGLIDPGIMGLTKPDGTANLPGVAKRLARHPADITKLARLGRDATKATNASAVAAGRWLRGEPLSSR